MEKKKKKVYKTSPKLRQRLAFKKVTENGGNLGKAMRDVGYSEVSSKSPKKLTESKGWKELMEEYLPDKLLAEKHQELLMAKKRVRKKRYGKVIMEFEEMDSNAIKAALDMGYKIKGAYKADNAQKSPVVIVNLEERAQIEKAIADLL